MGDRFGQKVMADYSQFVVADAEAADLVVLGPDEDDLVFCADSMISVRTGVQVGPVAVRVENLAAAPPDVDLAWEDIVELSVISEYGLVLGELMGDVVGTVTDGPGTYRMRISARGRDDSENRGDADRRATPLETFLIELWPAPAAPGITLRATSLKPVDHTAGRKYLESGRLAAQRIDADLDRRRGCRPLSGTLGTVTAEWTYAASRRKLFRPFALLHWWTSATSGGSSHTPAVGVQSILSSNTFRDIFDGIPTGTDRAHLVATILELEAPATVVTSWEWKRGFHGHGTPILDRPSIVTTRLSQSKGADGKPRTLVRIEHSSLPAEWLEDMTQVWLCRLEAGATVYRLEE